MRINFSHATYDEANLRVKNLRACKGNGFLLGGAKFNLRSVMLDTQGPEIRTGSFSGAVKEVECEIGDTLIFTNNASDMKNQTPDGSVKKIWVSYKALAQTVKKDSVILLDDGAIEVIVFDVVQQGINGPEVHGRVCNNGTLGNKKGVNLPGCLITLPAMSDKDREDIRWGVENDIDFIAASFTRKAQDVFEIRDYVSTLMEKVGGHP